MLGKCEPEPEILKKAKWQGLAVASQWGTLDDDDYYGDIKYVEGPLSTDPHFTRMMQGTWMKPITTRDIFDQWGSERFTLIIIDVEMLTRLLWYGDQVQVHMPKMHLIREDGHNEGVRIKATELGYACRVLEGDWLLMAK